MDSSTKILASGVGNADRGSASDEDLANSSDEDELIIDVVGECKDDARTLECSAEVPPHMSAQADDTATSSDSQLHCVAPTIARGGAVDITHQRRRISEQQRSVLWETFQRDSYPKREQLKLLAAHLNLDEKRIKSWFQNHRTQLRRSATPAAKTTPNVESPATPTAPAQKHEPAVMSTPRERTPLAANEAPEVATGTTLRTTAPHATTSTTCGSMMTQVSVSPNHPFYFLTDSRVDASTTIVKSVKRKTPSAKTPPPKSSRHGERAASEPCQRRRRMTPRQRREHRKLALQLVAQSPVANPDQPLDLSMKPADDRLTPPAGNTPSSEVFSSERRRSAFLPMVGRNSNDPCYYPLTMAMGLVPYVGVNYPHFPTLLGHQWPVHGHMKK